MKNKSILLFSLLLIIGTSVSISQEWGVCWYTVQEPCGGGLTINDTCTTWVESSGPNADSCTNGGGQSTGCADAAPIDCSYTIQVTECDGTSYPVYVSNQINQTQENGIFCDVH